MYRCRGGAYWDETEVWKGEAEKEETRNDVPATAYRSDMVNDK